MAAKTTQKKTSSTKSTSSTTPASTGSKAQKGGTGKKKGAPGTVPLPAGVSLSQLATEDDVTWLSGEKLPSAQTRQPSYALPALFTPAVVTRLSSDDVTAFYGSSINDATLQSDVDAANSAVGARDRFEASSIASGRIYGVPGKALEERIALVMSRWDAFEAAYPDDAAALDTLRTYWLAHHKTGPKKATASPASQPVASGASAGPAAAGPTQTGTA